MIWKEETKTNKRQCRFKIREGSPEGIRMTMEEKICERDEFQVWSEKPREW